MKGEGLVRGLILDKRTRCICAIDMEGLLRKEEVEKGVRLKHNHVIHVHTLHREERVLFGERRQTRRVGDDIGTSRVG